MPITKSAKRALRGSHRKRAFNSSKKEQVSKAIKQLKKLVSEKKVKEAKEFMPKVQKILDKAAKTGLIKSNKASRKKSRLSKMVKKAQ